MPGTAPTRNTDRSPRTRPSSVARGADQTVNTPTLFRLPIVGQGRGDNPPTPESEPTKLSQPALASPAPAAAAPAHVVFASPKATSPTATSPTATSPTATMAAAPSPAAERPLAAVASSHAPSRSWWEHWSSGIVLILLVIALVTASVMALNDSGNPAVDRLAEGLSTAATPELDLTSIQIPEIQLSPPVTPTASTTSELTADDDQAAAPAAKEKTPTSTAKSETAAEQLVTSGDSPSQAVAASAGEDGLILGAGELNAIADKTAATATANANKQTEQPAAPPAAVKPPETNLAGSTPQATLSTPVGKPQTPLFPELPHDPSLSVPSLTAAGPTAPPPAPKSGSPSFYDGASSIEQRTAAMGQAAAVAPGRPVDTQQPSLPAMLTGSSSQPVFSTASHTPGQSTNSTPPAAKASSSVGPTAPKAETQAGAPVVSSATPDMDAEAIIQAYLRYRELHKAQSMPSNRYQPTQGN